MKYDVLEPFKKYLQENLSPNTARTYYNAVNRLFSDASFQSPEQIPVAYMEQQLPVRCSTRNEFSAAKNGLKWFAKRYPQCSIPTEEFFKENSLKKRNFSKRPKKVIYLHPTMRKINQIQNEKLRYAYRLMAVSGLRVSETADLEAGDLTFQDGHIQVKVRNGKGGHGGNVTCREDPYLFEKLKNFAKQYQQGKLFYSEAHMRKEAGKLHFECHDLRRVFAIRSRRELKEQMPADLADVEVQRNLRHARFSTTKRYLYNRKLKMEYEYQEQEKRG